MSKRVKLLAIYFPQLHAIPENDRWWGTGLHRLDQRASARSRSSADHYQPRVPAGARLLRPGRAARHPAAGRHGARVRPARLLPLPLLVRRQAAPRDADQPVPRDEGARRRVLPLVGQRDLVAPLGRAGAPHPAASRRTRRRQAVVGRALRLPRPRVERSARASRRRPAGLHDLPARQASSASARCSTTGRAAPASTASTGFTSWPCSSTQPLSSDVLRHFDAHLPLPAVRWRSCSLASSASRRSTSATFRGCARRFRRPLAIRLQCADRLVQPDARVLRLRARLAADHRAERRPRGHHVRGRLRRLGQHGALRQARDASTEGAAPSASSTGSSRLVDKVRAHNRARASASSSSTPGTSGPKAPTSSPTSATASSTSRRCNAASRPAPTRTWNPRGRSRWRGPLQAIDFRYAGLIRSRCQPPPGYWTGFSCEKS